MRSMASTNKTLVSLAAVAAALASGALGLASARTAGSFADYSTVQTEQHIASVVARQAASSAQAVELTSNGQQVRWELERVLAETRQVILAQSENAGDREQSKNSASNDGERLLALNRAATGNDPLNHYPNLGAGTSSGGIVGFTALVNASTQSGGGVSPN
jgi:hypothetical protein